MNCSGIKVEKIINVRFPFGRDRPAIIVRFPQRIPDPRVDRGAMAEGFQVFSHGAIIAGPAKKKPRRSGALSCDSVVSTKRE